MIQKPFPDDFRQVLDISQESLLNCRNSIAVLSVCVISDQRKFIGVMNENRAPFRPKISVPKKKLDVLVGKVFCRFSVE
jgi:hypothetical protein